MHALLFTVLFVVGADRHEIMPTPDNQAVVSPDAQPLVGARDPYIDEGVICSWIHNAWDWSRPMPQTCYSPHFGCYPGNGRDIQRYPAFHGTYYRRAYNYRQLYEYPWQAEEHEPRRLLTNYVQGQEMVPAPPPNPAGQKGLPAPPRPLESSRFSTPGTATASQSSSPSRMIDR